MSVLLVITFTGPDRPGIVGRLSAIVASHGGNWEESRMAVLAGRFAGILKVTVPDDGSESLVKELKALEAEGMAVLVDRGAPVGVPSGYQPMQLDLTGADHPGIVREVAHVLAERAINIHELTSEAFVAPMSAEQMFRATALLDCPPDLDVDELQGALEHLARDLVVQIALRAAGRTP